MAKNINPTKVITGKDTRWSYCNIWDAKSINGGAPKFSISLIIPKADTATIQKVKAAIEAAYHEGESKLRGNGKTVPPLVALKTPLRDGDTATITNVTTVLTSIRFASFFRIISIRFSPFLSASRTHFPTFCRRQYTSRPCLRCG